MYSGVPTSWEAEAGELLEPKSSRSTKGNLDPRSKENKTKEGKEHTLNKTNILYKIHCLAAQATPRDDIFGISELTGTPLAPWRAALAEGLCEAEGSV